MEGKMISSCNSAANFKWEILRMKVLLIRLHLLRGTNSK